MTKRTRLFLSIAAGILIVGLGTGLIASYMGLQNLGFTGRLAPAELGYIPADTRMLAFANVRDVMDSELRQRLMQTPAGGAQGDPLGHGADQFFQETGIDIRTDVDQVMVSLSGAQEGERPLLLARGRFDQAWLEALVQQKGGSVDTYAGKRVLTHLEADLGIAFVEPGLVAVGTPASVRRAIDTSTGGSSVTGNAEVMRLLRDVEDGNAWAIARFDTVAGGQQIPEDLAKQLPPISWFAASGYVNGGVRGVLHVEARDEAAAADLRDVVRGFVALARMQAAHRAELADLMNSLELGGQGSTVSLGFAVPTELIDALGAMRAARPRAAPSPNSAPAAPEQPFPPSL